MTLLTRRNGCQTHPFAILDQLLEDPFFQPAAASQAASEQTHPTFSTLPVDITEDDKAVIVRASLPGFQKEEIEVEVNDRVLTIKATHAAKQEQSGERVHRRERRITSFLRRLALSEQIAEGQPVAELRDGVLTLRLPKAEKAQPRKIAIN